MFTTLIESRRTQERRIGGTTVSVLVHAAVITFGVYVTAQAREAPVAETAETPIIFALPADAPPNTAPRPPNRDAGGLPPRKGLQTLVPPIEIPDHLPAIDLTREITNADDVRGRVAFHDAAYGADDGARPSGDHTYFEFQVEKPALARDGNPAPRYPSMLESSRVAGEVVAQFVVDTTGKADMATFRILQSNNELFSAALESVIPRWRFLPAEAGGRKVKQIVQVPVRFVAPPSE